MYVNMHFFLNIINISLTYISKYRFEHDCTFVNIPERIWRCISAKYQYNVCNKFPSFTDINGHLQQQQQQQQQHQQHHHQQQQQQQQQQQSVPQIIICNPQSVSQPTSQAQHSTPNNFVPNPGPAAPPSIVILGGQGGNPSSQGNNHMEGRF